MRKKPAAADTAAGCADRGSAQSHEGIPGDEDEGDDDGEGLDLAPLAGEQQDQAVGDEAQGDAVGDGMNTMVQKAGMAFSMSLRSTSFTLLSMRMPTKMRAGAVAAEGMMPTTGPE